MGNGVDFYRNLGKPSTGESQYVSIGHARIVNGVKGRIVKRRGDSDTHSNLPNYSKTSDVYFRQNEKGVCQARVYLAHKVVVDFDWSHSHTNKGKDKRTFKAGTVHVQLWKQNSDGSFERLSKDARSMSNKEMKKYGPIIKAFCPWVKLR